MKKIIFLLIGILLFADDLYKKVEIPSVDLNKHIKIKFSMLKKIVSANLGKNDLIIGSSNKVKIYSLENNDILEAKNINTKKVQFSSDKSKILLLHKRGDFFILDKNFNVLKKIKGNFVDFDEKNGYLVLLGNDFFDIYDLKNLNKIGSGKGFSWAKFVILSPHSKRFLIFADGYIYIFNSKGNLLNKIHHPFFNDVKWLNDEKIIIDNGSYCSSNKILILNIVNSEVLQSFSTCDFIREVNNFAVLSPDDVLILSYNKMLEYNLSNNKIKKIFYLSHDNYINNVDFYNNKLLVSYYNDGYVYSYNFIAKKDSKHDIAKSNKVSKINKELSNENIKINKNKPKNYKPILEIYASKLSGFSPLTVTFSLFADDKDGKIIAYYLNIDGKEYLFTKPKKITYTFTTPGVYEVMAAVKDNSGNITIKKIKITVKEETFEDFKEHL